MKIRDSLLTGFLILMAFSSLAAGDPQLLPREGFQPDWKRSDRGRLLEGTALYDHIDGGAEAFLELGFGALSMQKYRHGKDEISVEIYRMTDPDAALGIYLANCGRETPDKTLAERHTLGQTQILMAKGPYYVVVRAMGGREGLAGVLLAAATAIASAIPVSTSPAAPALLPAENLLDGSIRIIRGPVGLNAIATLGHGDVLLLGGKVTAAAGDYRDGSVSKTLIAAEYPSAEAASAALKNLGDHLDPLLKKIPSATGTLAFQEAKGTFGRATAKGARLEIELGLAQKAGA